MGQTHHEEESLKKIIYLVGGGEHEWGGAEGARERERGFLSRLPSECGS